MKKSMLIVELVGPAGSGKTTLTGMLARQAGIQVGSLPNVRSPKYFFFFVWNLFLLTPTFLTLYSHKEKERWLHAYEMVYMVILKGWASILAQQAVKGKKMMVLDQGPVYLLAELLRFGPEYLQSPAAKKWWDETCREFAAALDAVICIDAVDPVLMERIRSRAKSHGIKENSNEWAARFLLRYRWAQEKVLSSFATEADFPEVIRLDTAQLSLDETIAKILAVYKTGKDI